MNRLHAIWLPDCAVISFWAEDLTDTESTAHPRPGEHTPYHPRAFSFRQLERLLPDAFDPFEDEHLLRLPSREDCPIPSSLKPSHTNLRPWTVQTADVLSEAFFEHVFDDDFISITEEIEMAPDLVYWMELASFGRLLFESGHYVPGSVQLEGKIYPAWKSVICRESKDYWASFVNALPMIATNVVDPHVPHHRTEELVLSFLDACIDTLARSHGMRRNPVQPVANKPLMPLHRQWLNSLRHGRFQPFLGKGAAIQAFALEADEWVCGLRPTLYAPTWRLEFDLHAPETMDAPWQLVFVLGNVMQPDHRLACEDLWDDERAHRLIPHGRDVLFAGLGKAMETVPILKHALDSPMPTGLSMSADEAAEFMQADTLSLRRLGYRVTLPETLEEVGAGIRVRVKILRKATGAADKAFFLGLNDLVDYRWEVTLGDNALTDEEFHRLSEEKQKLINRDGSWYRLDMDKLQRTIGFMNAHGVEQQGSISDILALGKKLDKQNGIPLHEIAMDNQMQDLVGNNPNGQFELLPQPTDFKGHLPPYQVQGFSWMTFMKSMALGACLADDMGLGKTIQMISVLLHERTNGNVPDTSLIVCPMSVVGNWVHELERFAPSLKVMVHHGTDRLGPKEFEEQAHTHDAVISTYNLILRDGATFRRIEWENVILDEAQNVKNPSTKQSKAIRSLRSKNRFCLTGTPIENRLTELWSIMDFLNPGFLGTIGNFRSHFSVPIERDNDENRSAILQRLIRPFVLRRLKSDKEIIRDLPEKSEMKVFCNLSTEQASLYQAVVDDMMNRITQSHGIERKGLVLSTLTKLKQISNHPSHFLGDASAFSTVRSGKLQRLEEMLEVVLESGDRALVFTQYSKLGTMLRAKLQERFGIEVLYMHGGSSKKQRDEMVSRFQRPNGPPLFLLSLKAGGVGLNLTAANHVFHFDRWWNPAIEDQATDRTYRIGQSKNVQVHKFICVGTVEEKIDAMIEDKKRLANNIVSAGESFLTELTTEELLSVFSLSRDTIIE